MTRLNERSNSKITHDFVSEEAEHHFCVSIPNSKNGDVLVTENYMRTDPDLPPVLSDTVKARVIMSRPRWEAIAPSLRHEFNERLKKYGKKSGNWKSGYNEVSRTFGKELVVLAWAIEQTNEENIPTAIQNWLGLLPEERWWLYTQANAATGHAEKGRGKGWRKAIEIALTENPTTISEPSSNARAKPASKSSEELIKALTIS